MNRVATTKQLERYAGFLARLVLEVERNLRPPDQLLQFVPIDAWRQWQRGRQAGRFRGGPVQDADIGPPHVQRVSATHALASVTTRTEPDRWGALALRLDAAGGRWQAASIHRLYVARHYRGGSVAPVIENSLEQRVQTARSNRDQAAAALRAIEQCLTDRRTNGSDQQRDTNQLAATWRNVVAELDREVTALTDRQRAATATERALRHAL